MSRSEDEVLFHRAKSKHRRERRKIGFVLYESFYEPLFFLNAVYKQLLVLGLMFVFGAAVFSYYEALPPLDAFLASVSTITTIGLYVPKGGNFLLIDRGEATLLILLIIVSVGAGASAVQSTVSAVVNGDLAKGKAEKKLIERLKGHVIIFGYGHLGKYVAEKLDELGFDSVVVTRDPHLYADLLDKKVLAVLEHESHPLEALRASGIERAEMVVSSHSEDPDNMLIVMGARKLNPKVRVVTVVHDPGLVETAKDAGADMVIPASVTLGHLLALSAVTKDLVGVVFSEKIGTKEIAQFTVFKSSPLVGKGMSEVRKLAAVIGVVRNDTVVGEIFEPDFRIQEDDTLLVLGDPSNLETLEKEARAT